MKIYNYFFFFIFILSLFSACKTTKSYYYDVNGDEMTEEAFLEKSRQKEYYLWVRMIEDSIREVHLKKPRFKILQIDHDIFLNQVENLTGKKFSNTLTFLILYKYRDDECINKNKVNKIYLNNRRSYYKYFMEKKENENLILLVFYENGILVSNKNKKEKFFYKDKDNYFRQNIFKTPALCGSWAIVKPEGNILIQNGESSLSLALKLMEPKYWSKIFPR